MCVVVYPAVKFLSHPQGDKLPWHYLNLCLVFLAPQEKAVIKDFQNLQIVDLQRIMAVTTLHRDFICKGLWLSQKKTVSQLNVNHHRYWKSEVPEHFLYTCSEVYTTPQEREMPLNGFFLETEITTYSYINIYEYI